MTILDGRKGCWTQFWKLSTKKYRCSNVNWSIVFEKRLIWFVSFYQNKFHLLLNWHKLTKKDHRKRIENTTNKRNFKFWVIVDILGGGRCCRKRNLKGQWTISTKLSLNCFSCLKVEYLNEKDFVKTTYNWIRCLWCWTQSFLHTYIFFHIPEWFDLIFGV